MKTFLSLVLTFTIGFSVFAQSDQDTEFTKGYIFPVSINSGMITQFNNTPELFTGSLSINPQWTVVENLMRVGPSAGLAYGGNEVSGLFGVSVAIKVTTWDNIMGSFANIYVQPNAQWGTEDQQLLGLALGIEVFKRIHIQLRCDRDYNLNNWQIQSGVAYNLFKTKENQDD